MEKHIKIRTSLLQVQVCSEGTEYEALAWVRTRHPAGTENNWQIDDNRERSEPVQCGDHPPRMHYLFIC